VSFPLYLELKYRPERNGINGTPYRFWKYRDYIKCGRPPLGNSETQDWRLQILATVARMTVLSRTYFDPFNATFWREDPKHKLVIPGET
jgi:hypothetical protein